MGSHRVGHDWSDLAAAAAASTYLRLLIFLLEILIPEFLIEKAREFQKNIYFCFINYAKAFDCVDRKNCGIFWKRWEYQTTWPASWETYMQVRKQQLELDMEQQTGSK